MVAKEEPHSVTGNGNLLKKRDYYVVCFLDDCRVKLMNHLIIKGICGNHTERLENTLYQEDRETHNIRVRVKLNSM